MTRPSSVRAKAREIYCRSASQKPVPSPEPDLTTQVRALYEHSAVPVREIARLADVTERTIYKYVRKGHWSRRHRVAAVRDAGARFIRREDHNQPVAQGLKATDPAGVARASAACCEAELVSSAAQAEAQRWQRVQAMIRAIKANNFALSEYRRWREGHSRERTKQRDLAHAKKCATLPGRFRAREPKGSLPPPTPRDVVIEGLYLKMVSVALSRWQALLKEEKAEQEKASAV